MTIATGEGTNSLAYSYDNGLTWTGLGTNIFSSGGFGYGVSWNGSMWVAVGTGTNRIAYSLQQQTDSNVDAWRTFLPLNTVDFKSKLSSVKNFAKTGMFITFENDMPLLKRFLTLQVEKSWKTRENSLNKAMEHQLHEHAYGQGIRQFLGLSSKKRIASFFSHQ